MKAVAGAPGAKPPGFLKGTPFFLGKRRIKSEKQMIAFLKQIWLL
jgi:hypothetical protein